MIEISLLKSILCETIAETWHVWILMYEELSEMEALFSWAAVGREADVHSKSSQVTENPEIPTNFSASASPRGQSEKKLLTVHAHSPKSFLLASQEGGTDVWGCLVIWHSFACKKKRGGIACVWFV